ncbi:Hypothetical predicted protein, partial [Marmota monax]
MAAFRSPDRPSAGPGPRSSFRGLLALGQGSSGSRNSAAPCSVYAPIRAGSKKQPPRAQFREPEFGRSVLGVCSDKSRLQEAISAGSLAQGQGSSEGWNSAALCSVYALIRAGSKKLRRLPSPGLGQFREPELGRPA